MKNCCKLLIVICIIFLSTGCVRYNSTMSIKSDRSMDYSIIYAYQKSIYDKLDVSWNDDVRNKYKSAGYTVEDYEEDNYYGIKLTTHVDDIKNISINASHRYNLYESVSNYEPLSDVFQIKEGIFKDTYKAIFYYESDTDYSDFVMDDSMDLKFTVILPTKAISNNATEVSDDGKKLVWDLTKLDISNDEIQFEFEMVNTYPIILIGLIGLIVLLIIVVFIMSKINKHKNSSLGKVDLDALE